MINMIDKIKNLFKTNVPDEQSKPKTANNTRKVKKKTAKELATERGEPYVNVISMEIDSEDFNNGAFELDWNDIFITKLVRAGYKGATDQQIVDQWFQNVCRNVVLENYEQEQADPERRVLGKKRIDKDRTEFS
jgi:hypothetical protein